MKNGIGTVFQRTGKGFTLVELIIVIAILAVAIGIAAPSYVNFIQNNQLTSSTNQFISAVNYARNEAINRQEDVRISGDGNGWVVTAIPVTATPPQTLATYNLVSNLRIIIDVDDINNITFSPNGFRALDGNTIPFNLTICDPDRSNTRIVRVSAAGTTSVTKGAGGCPE